MAATPQFGRGVVGLLKRGWHEIPDVVGGSVMALIGIGLAVTGVSNYYANDGDNRRYKMQYIVMRSDDPRAEKVHKD